MRSGILQGTILMALCLLFLFVQPTADPADGLESLGQVISIEQVQQLPEPRGAVRLTCQGALLPYDRATNTYYIPQSPDTALFEGGFMVEAYGRSEVYIAAPEASLSKQEALEGGAAYDVYVVTGDACYASAIVFTPLPVAWIATESGEMPGDEDQLGTLRMFTADSGEIRAEEYRIETNLRGNTSKTLPKKSYRVKLIHEDGKKRHASLCGLREDDDWILNPMYTDATKVRETLSYELWSQISRSGTAADSSRIAYAEVLFNGAYWGLYGVQERVDRKQVDGDRQGSILYKVETNQRPEVEELRQSNSSGQVKAFVADFAGAGVEELWLPAADYMAYINGDSSGETAVLSTENVIDYGIWAMVTQAHDNHFKNQYLHCLWGGEQYDMYKIPWDLNYTLGDVHRLKLTENNCTDFYIGAPIMDSAFEAMLRSDGDVNSAVEYWWSLRRGELTEEGIARRAQEIFDSIAPAVARDSLRWPQSGYGSGNDEGVESIVEYLDGMLPRIDAKMAQLGLGRSE